MLNFNFSEKDLGPVPPSHFVYDCSKKTSHVTFYQLTKNIFIIFQGLSVVENCLRPESAPLKVQFISHCLMNNLLGLHHWTFLTF